MLLGIGVYRLAFFRFKDMCLLQAFKSREKKTWAVRAAITVPPAQLPAEQPRGWCSLRLGPGSWFGWGTAA